MQHTLHASERWRTKGSHLCVGVDWVMRGVIGAEIGVDMLLASRAEQVWGLDRSLRLFKDDLDEGAISVELAENDVVTAGLLRAGILAARRVVALFEMRGLRQAFDVLYETSRVTGSPQGAGLIVACESHGPSTRVWSPDPSAAAPSAPRGKPGLAQALPADPRELAVYLGIPLLTPSSPSEIAADINEGLRLARAARSLVMLWITPMLVGSGETEHDSRDTSIRAASPAEIRPDDTSTPFHVEVRRRELSRILNPPVQGEESPLGFITAGTAHTSLRHALNLLGQTGRFPILKLAHLNPVDRRAVEQFLLRVKRVIVVEGGRSILEQNVHGIARELARAGHENVAQVYGKLLPPILPADPSDPHTPASVVPIPSALPQPDLSPGQRRLAAMISKMGFNPAGAAAGLPWTTDLHPSEIALRLAPILQSLRVGDPKARTESLARLQELAGAPLTLARPRPRTSRRDESLVRLLVDSAVEDLREELSQPAADRRPIDLDVESIDTAPLEEHPGRRTIVEFERRRLAGVGRAAITHAIRRRLSITFLILPDSVEKAQRFETSEADRLVRGVIREAEAPAAAVTTLDPSDGPAFRHALKGEILFPGVSVVIVDAQPARLAPPIAGPAEEWAHLGYAPIQAWVRPGSANGTLCYEWLTRRGWDQPSLLDGVRGPRIERHRSDWLGPTALDGWDHFEEIRLARTRAPRASTRWFEDFALPDPVVRNARDPHWRIHLCGPAGRSLDLAVLLLEQAGQRMGYRVQVLRGRDGAGAFAQIAFSRPTPGEPLPPITPRIPYGQADLLLALDERCLIEALDADGGHRVASTIRTAAVLDNSPHLSEALGAGASTADESPAGSDLAPHFTPQGFLPLQAAEISAELLNGRDLAGVALLGAAFQKGWVPLTWESLHRASQRVPDDPLNLIPTALRLGRSFVLGPNSVPDQNHDLRSPVHAETLPRAEAVIRRHHTLIRRRIWRFGSARRADAFRRQAYTLLDAVPGLRRADSTTDFRSLLALRFVDCEVWGGMSACAEFSRRILAIYRAEDPAGDYPVTRGAIQELARGMLYADPVFVAATVSRPDRLRAQRRLRGCRPFANDRLTLTLRMRVGPPIAANFGLGPLAGVYVSLSSPLCTLLGSCRFLRWWPWWARREKQYRQDILSLFDRCPGDLPQRAPLWIEIINQLQRVRGCEPRRLALIRRSRMAIAAALELAAPARP